ncbi:MAG: hypothetical protein AAGJ93_11980 [Bacteroidota bacterium]
MLINDLLLPETLQRLMDVEKGSKAAIKIDFSDIVDSAYAVELSLLSRNEITATTANYTNISQQEKEAKIYGLYWNEKPNLNRMEELLDMNKALIIALNFDEEAIGLDYRFSSNPRVVFSDWSNSNCRWRLISLNFYDFLEKLRHR